MKQKKVPIRKCVACGQALDKKDLFRIVRSPEGDVFLDITGKKNGRGAYLSRDKECIEKARTKNLLSKQLKTPIGDEIFNEMLIIIGDKQNG